MSAGNEPPTRRTAQPEQIGARVPRTRRTRAEAIAADWRFCEEYAASGNQSHAARAAFPELAGKDSDTASKRGKRQLRRPEIAAAVAALRSGPPTFAANDAARAALAGFSVAGASAPPACAARPSQAHSSAQPEPAAVDSLRRGIAVALGSSAPDLERLFALRVIAAELDTLRRARAPGDDVVIAIEIRIGAGGATSARTR